MTQRLFVVEAVLVFAALAVAGCAKKPAQKAEAGQVSAPLATPATEDGCRACNGVWGVHGLDQTPRCVCRTKDAGKTCRGKDDCEGECIADGGEKEVKQPGPPPLGFWIGRCAEMRTTFGCHAFLPHNSGQPVRLDTPLDQLCVD